MFDGVLLLLLPQMPKAQLAASVLTYRFLLEAVPLLIGLALFAFFEIKTRRLRAQRGGSYCRPEDPGPGDGP